jgi:ParB family chromosome partitioning protein
LIAGARRFRASKLAGKDTIPATVRDLTDAECSEIQLIENLQRADIHELDEGIGYRALMELKPDFYTVENIAVQVAKSASYVKGRISLTDLIPAVQTAFYEGKLSVAHALELARLQPADQERALMECFPGHRSTNSILKDRKAEAVTVRQLRDWIERELHLDLRNAPFDGNDADLLPAAGACSACPKRTGNNPLLFPEIRNKSLCTDPACYRAKIQALVQIRIKPLAKEGRKPVQISSAPYWQARSKSADTLYEGQYRRVENEGDCPHTQAAVVVDGREAGTVLRICADESCKTHRQFSHYEVSPQEREQRRKLALAIRIQKESRSSILQAVWQKLPPGLARADFGEGQDQRSADFYAAAYNRRGLRSQDTNPYPRVIVRKDGFSVNSHARPRGAQIRASLVLSAYLQFKTVWIAKVEAMLGRSDFEAAAFQFVFHLSSHIFVRVPVCNRQADVIDHRRSGCLARMKDELRFSDS